MRIFSSTLLCVAALASAQAGEATLVARSVLPAETYASGPTSGQQLGTAPINGVTPPFTMRQPVQGFSAVLREPAGTYLVMCDNGYGAMENSSDFNLRLYRVLPLFETASGGPGQMRVVGRIELHDPDRKVPFAITNHFSAKRVLTGADFDIESVQRGHDGSLWFGDEFGPFLLHTDANGKVLEAPIALPDQDHPGQELRSPQNPFNEESSPVRVMNAMRNHARRFGSRTPVFSPYHVQLVDGNPAVDHYARGPVSPVGSGLAPAASETIDVDSLHRAGYPVVCWTVNDSARMAELLKLKLDGIISDRSDLLYAAVAAFDANGDGVPGDFLLPDGRIDPAKFDAQGHRGSRNLRPENTLPAMEVALDNLMTTLETDCGITRDWVAVLNHDPHVQSQKTRRFVGGAEVPYSLDDEVLVKSLTLSQLQTQFKADKVFRGPSQMNDVTLSPVTMAFRAAGYIPSEYAMPSLAQLFRFVDFYRDYYHTGAGAGHPMAGARWRNAATVRFNIETKTNPRAEYASRTYAPWVFSLVVGGTISAFGMQDRADIQSFDFRELLQVHVLFPSIRTVCLFGDFPIYADRSDPDSDDGTNMQDEFGANTPWLAGLYWPYRVTRLTHPFRVGRSSGFEGMAISPNGKHLFPLLEKPLVDGPAGTLYIHHYDIPAQAYTNERWPYMMGAGATNIGDFVLFNQHQGLVIERDGTQGRLDAIKRIYEVRMGDSGEAVQKELLVDLLNIKDPATISLPARPGDIGLGTRFAFPFETIEDVVVIDRTHIGVLNDNNFPFSKGRNPQTATSPGRPDDNEFIILKLDRPLGRLTNPGGKG